MSEGIESRAGGNAQGHASATAPGAVARPAHDEVHLWVAALETSDDVLSGLARTLSADEQRRCQAYRFERHRRLFVAQHGWLRTVLGRYVGLAPERVSFVYGAHGKPALARECDADLQFNLSHSRTLAALALADGRAVGVDVEALRPVRDAEQIAEHFFSPQERDTFRRLPAPQRTEAFFNCWTRKEAYVKALGEGLACPLDGFDVSLEPGVPARVERVGSDASAAERWRLWHLTPAPGYVGAVAVLGRDCSLVSRT